MHNLALPLVTLSASFTYPSAHSVRALQGAATRLNQLGHDSWLLVDKVCTQLLAEDPVVSPLPWCLCLLRWCILHCGCPWDISLTRNLRAPRRRRRRAAWRALMSLPRG